MELRDEVKGVKEKNKIQKKELMEKDEEKREVVRASRLRTKGREKGLQRISNKKRKKTPIALKTEGLKRRTKKVGQESCITKNATKPRNITECGETDTPRATEEGGGEDPDGESAMLGPGATTWNGSGGLRLEGIVGSGDSAGGGPALLGEGKSGVISGDKVGEEKGREGFGRCAGAAEMVEVGKASEDEHAMRIVTHVNCALMEAIQRK
ncbi:hypothetical protein RHSIM_Rhsim01G0280100 [Rhododendron simsii]|uniref:Uncharacterized protein n=1 Tax=Rhododendron simsii TaxID=118357 RepID=A0A834HHM3_RHOSS|nr:hypothetical protein RHSIM_Rhsim01G0280100 [Rhododendron simsii]